MMKLSEKELIAKLKTLKQIEPGSVWVDFCRKWLTERINIKEQIITFNKPVNKQNILLMPEFVEEPKFNFFKINLAPAMAALSGLLVLSSAGLVFASKDSLPGNLLFPIKIAYEKTHLFLTPDAKKATLQISIVNARLEELDKLVAVDKKSNNIIQAVKQLNQELVAVKKQLPQIAQDKKLDEVIKIAKTATEITNKIPMTAAVISSVCDSFASSSCAVMENNDQGSLSIQTSKMAEEIMKNVEELSKKGSSSDSNQKSVMDSEDGSSGLR